jgi:nucleoside-diphosphate-sugar epimerase
MATADDVVRRLAGTRVLVTGARGFIGRHLCARLVAAGAEVIAVSRHATPADGNGIRWRQCDLEDFADAARLVHALRPGVLFHLSGKVTAAPDVSLVLPTFHSLLTSTVNLLTLATEQGGGRVVFTASMEEPYGEPAEDVVPASPYSAAKSAASAYARMFHRLYGCPVVTVRLFMGYGPGQAADKVIPSTILSLLRQEAPRLSSGRRPLDWVYVEDVIDGLLRAATAPGVEGATIDLGSGTLRPVREIVERLVRLMDSSVAPIFGALPDRPGAHVRVARIERAARLLGWRPNTPLDAGLARTIEWYRAHLPMLEAHAA